MVELTLNQQIEVVTLRVQRRQLLSEEPNTELGRKQNLKKRLKLSARLFQLTRNPIYIHF
jgi:hypothetical protein